MPPTMEFARPSQGLLARAMDAARARAEEDEAIIRQVYDDRFANRGKQDPGYEAFRDAAQHLIEAIRRASRSDPQGTEGGQLAPELSKHDVVNRAEVRRLLHETNRNIDEIERLVAAL